MATNFIRTATDIGTGASLTATPWLLQYAREGMEFTLVVGGIVIMGMRLWLLYKEITDRKEEDGRKDAD